MSTSILQVRDLHVEFNGVKAADGDAVPDVQLLR